MNEQPSSPQPQSAKFLTLVAICTAANVAAISAQEVSGHVVRTAPPATVATLPPPLVDAIHSTPRPPVEKPELEILNTQVKLLDVVQPPPMAGLPPVEGTITLRVHSVENPGIPDPPPPPVPRTDLDPEAKARLSAASAKHRETRIAFVSASVYDGTHTLLTCYPNGAMQKSVSAWSNLDFSHFQGIGKFDATDADGTTRHYSLMMFVIRQVSTQRLVEQLAARGVPYMNPEIPAFPAGNPSFLLQTEKPDSEMVTLIEDLHALYRTEGEKMAQLQAARELAHEQQKAWLLANPPKPKDVTVHFWNRSNEDENLPQEGGQP